MSGRVRPISCFTRELLLHRHPARRGNVAEPIPPETQRPTPPVGVGWRAIDSTTAETAQNVKKVLEYDVPMSLFEEVAVTLLPTTWTWTFE